MSKATRQAFGEALAKLGESHSEIVVLDADLAKSTKSEIFAKKFPDRFFEMGIQEANMIGVAAGLSFTGKLPFLCSFGCFITGRYDTIRLSVAYSGANVRLIGTHAGVGIGDDGHSQMGLEDVALMRALPTMGVFQPMDAKETDLVMKHLVKEWKGPAYLRLTRQNLPDLLTDEGSWRAGKLHEVRPFSKSLPRQQRVLFIGSGAGTAEAVQARDLLAAQAHLDVSVWNAHCLKPFDEETLAQLSAQAAWIVTVEDHSVIGGLGSCVADALAKTGGSRLLKIGVEDQFGESGEPAELFDKFGLSAQKIAARVLETCK